MDNATVAAPILPAHPVFQGASFGILTDANPRFPLGNAGHLRPLQTVLEEGQRHGVLRYEVVRGRYGGSDETSFIIYDVEPETMAFWGTLYGQESIIYSEGGQNQLLFTNGPRAGRYHAGQGFTVFEQEPSDYFSTVQTQSGPVHFSLDLNFDALEPALAKAA
jgi:hypothetical protein